jgi:hypothetical protein
MKTAAILSLLFVGAESFGAFYRYFDFMGLILCFKEKYSWNGGTDNFNTAP